MSKPEPRHREPRGKLGPRQQQLAESYMPLARKMAKQHKKQFPWLHEEFESAACLALVEAAESFDPDRKVKFATFARLRISGALRDVHRNMIIYGWRCDPAHAPTLLMNYGSTERKGLVLGINPDQPLGHEMEGEDEFEAWMRKLPRKHAQAFREIYVKGKTQHEAAAAMGCSQARLSYLHREAIAMLKGEVYKRNRKPKPPRGRRRRSDAESKKENPDRA